MIEFAESDFVTLDAFSLGWRFTPDRVGTLSTDTLRRIRPLTAERATDFARVGRAQCDEAARFGLTFRSDDSPGAVRERLRALPPAAATEILISWDAQTVVATDWATFITHWDDFCYRHPTMSPFGRSMPVGHCATVTTKSFSSTLESGLYNERCAGRPALEAFDRTQPSCRSRAPCSAHSSRCRALG
jgi:hypothetical protein